VLFISSSSQRHSDRLIYEGSEVTAFRPALRRGDFHNEGERFAEQVSIDGGSNHIGDFIGNDDDPVLFILERFFPRDSGFFRVCRLHAEHTDQGKAQDSVFVADDNVSHHQTFARIIKLVMNPKTTTPSARAMKISA
jgi:hypothetical protein